MVEALIQAFFKVYKTIIGIINTFGWCLLFEFSGRCGMKELIFLTDRYPYNNSEAFIENEISFLARAFDRVYILPCGLMINTVSVRNVPENVEIIAPPCQDDIFAIKPSKKTKIVWGLRNLLGWYILCLLNVEFYKEIKRLLGEKRFSIKRCFKIMRTLSPAIRNKTYYKKFFKNKKLGDVYAYSYWIEPTVLFAKKIVGKTITKSICRTHRWDLYEEENSYNYLPLQKRIIEYVDELISISQDGADYLRTKYPNLATKINVSYLGTTDLGLNANITDEKRFRIVSCSNIIPVKRIDLLINSLAEYISNYRGEREIEWIHFGTGQYHKQIEGLAEKKLNGKLNYSFAGQVTNRQLMDYYSNNRVDVFINVSSSEGIPVSIMEATSFGIPVIATDVGGIRELIKTKVNGYLLKKDFSANDFCQAMNMIIENNDLYASLRLGARKEWEDNYSATENYKKFTDRFFN